MKQRAYDVVAIGGAVCVVASTALAFFDSLVIARAAFGVAGLLVFAWLAFEEAKSRRR